MKRNVMLGIFLFILLSGCVPEEDTEEKHLSTGIQYIGSQDKLLAALEGLELVYENPTSINMELEEYKLVIIEPNQMQGISKEKIVQALSKNYYIFFINLEESRLIQEQYFSTSGDYTSEQDKIWAEQLYLKNGQLQSIVFSTESNFEEELLKWLQYFDHYKVRNKN